MGKDFLKLNNESKKLHWMIFLAGTALTIILGVRAYGETKLTNGYELPKNEESEGAYDQEVIAYVGEKKIPLTVTVDFRQLSKEEAEKELLRAKGILDEMIKGENSVLSEVTKDLHFAEQIPESIVEVTWTETASEYFESDGKIRKEIDISEPVELKLSAILSCQEYVKEYEKIITLYPPGYELEDQLLKLIKAGQKNREADTVVLPKKYEGQVIFWRKPMDMTFVYFFALTVGAIVFLKFGGKRDEKEAQKQRLEELEKDYAKIVSKFTMLLSAGLSIRNAWERIVRLYQKYPDQESVTYQELSWGMKELQKGISELEVYESFAFRVGEIHYKKLMILFVSYKKRGSIHLLEAMNQEMLQAWEEQKRKTRQQGEQLGTKLLIPMMGMLACVFIIIMVPAFLAFQL